MFWDKATSNSEIVKPVALSIVELCLSEGIKLVSYSVSYCSSFVLLCNGQNMQ